MVTSDRNAASAGDRRSEQELAEVIPWVLTRLQDLGLKIQSVDWKTGVIGIDVASSITRR